MKSDKRRVTALGIGFKFHRRAREILRNIHKFGIEEVLERLTIISNVDSKGQVSFLVHVIIIASRKQGDQLFGIIGESVKPNISIKLMYLFIE